MIKLLALDLDGTLLNSRGEILDANREAIRSAEERGVLVTIATGRRFRDGRPLGIDLELNAPLVTHNGALLKYADSLKTVAASLLTTETAREVVRVGKAFGGDALVSADPHGKGALLYDRVADDNVPFQRYIRWSEMLHGDEAHEAVMHVDDLDNILSDHEIIHVSFSGTCVRMEEMIDYLKTELGDTVTVLPTIYPRRDFTLIDILPPDASKGRGVEKLARLNNITADEVMTMGDNFNDLEMLEFAGTGVVMGNADPSLRERGEFYTTVTNDEG
ncbi:MAG TPA: Cof-type HAD-IIB family hydrolase, partial [Pyrinomonadaceae bacterium]|nr:Cof-type HAD-IIB family hydrolase [Pyrinomonadaceae bacterium]